METYESALVDLNTLIESVPTESKIYTQRGHTHLALKKYNEALRDFSLAVLINPNVETYFNRGLLFLDIHNYKKANKDLSKSLRLDPSNASGYFYRGLSHLFLEVYDKALSDFLKTLQFNALDYDALLGLALTYYKINDVSNAKSNFERAARLLSSNSENSKTINLFVDTYWYKDQYVFFKKYFELLNKL